MKLLGIAGSLREGSHTLRLTELVLEEARAFGADTRLIWLRDYPLPLLNPNDESPNEVFDRIREEVLWADALVMGSPDYHGSISGALKNFLDYFWQEFMGKLFGYIVASHEKGLTVHEQMRTAVRQCYGWSLPYGISFNGDQDFDKNRNIQSETLRRRVQMMARDLVIYGDLLHRQFIVDTEDQPRQPGFAQKYRG